MELFKLVGKITIDGVEEANSKLENVSKKAKGFGDKFKSAGEKISGIGKKLAPVSAAVAGVGAAMVAAAENSREYRTDMGKLETAFTTMGHSTEAATNTYKGLQAVLGETDQSVEAANHLAKLCDNEKDLQTWTDICTGVFATFGDSLPIEGLTEAANETAKVGQVTGPLADALNWAGVSEDEFNKKLAACNTEQERAALITETLNGLYSEAADGYREVNEEVIAANEAQEKWNSAIAKVGSVVEPAISTVKNALAGVIGSVAEWFGNLSGTTQTVILVIGGVVAAIGPALMIIGGLVSAIGSVISILPALGAAFAVITGPVGIVIGVITAVVAGIAILWNKCEGFRNFWIEVWTSIKQIATEFLPALRDYMVKEFNNIKNKVVDIVTGIQKKWQEFKDKVSNLASELMSKLLSVFESIKSGVTQKIQALVSAGQEKFNALKTAITEKMNAAKTSALSIFDSIKTGITNKINAARDAVKSAIDRIKGFFNFSWSLPKLKLPHISISGRFSLNPPSVPKFGISWYKKAMENAMILNSPTIFGYSSASGKFLGGGEAGSEVIAGQNTLMNMISGAVAEQNASLASYLQTLVKMLSDYFPQILEAAGHDIVTNDGVIVARYAPLIDSQLGKISARKERGR